MGRKRKVEKDSVVVNEDKTSDAYPVITDSVAFPPKERKVTTVLVRRSIRIQNSTLPNKSQNVEPVMEQVNFAENGKHRARQVQQVSSSPVVGQSNLEVEAQQSAQLNHVPMNETNLECCAVSEVEPETFKQVIERPNEGSSTDFSYKSLYFDSQKQIESMTEKHLELLKELEFARGKLEAYEKMHNAMFASKEMLLVPRTENATGATTLHLSNQTLNRAGPIATSLAKASRERRNTYRKAVDAADDDRAVLPKLRKSSCKKKNSKS